MSTISQTSPSAAPAFGIAPPGFRLPSDTHLGRVRLQVADVDRSIAYYESVLGLRVIDRDAAVATLGPVGGDLAIVELHAKRGVRPVSRRGNIGLYHFAVLLPDRAALGRFVKHLADLGVYAGMSDHLVSEALYLQDPDGLGIEVYADRPRSTWKYDNAQLTMATDPLNVQSVIAAASGEPWAGAPVGTTLGHVHLYVRDIDAAAKFYHEGLGFDKVVWNYPGALFMSAGGYHHHLGTNTWAQHAPAPTDDDARLLEWEVVVPDEATVRAVGDNLERQGAVVERVGPGISVRDPWGTQVRVRI